ncbi:MAG: AzlC family ABC transporter permease [Thermomicrobiales bacterium]
MPEVENSIPERSTFTRTGVLRGLIGTVPFGLSALAFGTAFGVLAGSLPGIGAVGAILMSITVYSGSAQMVGLDLWGSQAGILAIWMTTLLISLRYVLLGLTTRTWFAGHPRWIGVALPFTMSDEVWALTFGEFERDRRDLGFFLGSGMVMMSCWVSGTAIGLAIGERVPDPAALGIDFVATAAFTGLIAGMYNGKSQLLPWLTAAAIAIAAERWLPGQWYILLGAAAGMIVGVWNEKRCDVI